MFHFHSFPNAQAAACALAQAVSGSLRDILHKQERATLAVSGGKSPIAFFQALSVQDLDWPRVNITLADERMVPVSHPDSNTALVRQYLLQNRAAAARWLPLVDDAADEGCLKDSAAAVSFALQHYVQPDIVVLGMGADGHTASLFPQAPQLGKGLRADYPQPLLHVSPVTALHERISVTLAAIERSTRVYLSIAGEDKLAVYHRAAEGISPLYPVSSVLHSEKADCHVFYS